MNTPDILMVSTAERAAAGTLSRSHFRRVTPTQSAEESPKSRRINWPTIVFSQTLGTAPGD